MKRSRGSGAPCGAHLLLQIRTRVLNGDLADDFARRYPGFTGSDQPPVELVA